MAGKNFLTGCFSGLFVFWFTEKAKCFLTSAQFWGDFFQNEPNEMTLRKFLEKEKIRKLFPRDISTLRSNVTFHSLLTACLHLPTAQSCYNLSETGEATFARSRDITLGDILEGELTLNPNPPGLVVNMADLGTYDDIAKMYEVRGYDSYTTILASGPNNLTIGSDQKPFTPHFVPTEGMIPTDDHVYIFNYTSNRDGPLMIVKILFTGSEFESGLLHTVYLDWDVIYHQDPNSTEFPCFQVRNGAPNVYFNAVVETTVEKTVEGEDNSAFLVLAVFYGIALLILGVGFAYLFWKRNDSGQNIQINSPSEF